MARRRYPSDGLDQFMIRLPDGMREQIKQAAAANSRTMNAEIVARLTQSFAAEARNVKMLQAFEKTKSGSLDQGLKRHEPSDDLLQQFGPSDNTSDHGTEHIERLPDISEFLAEFHSQAKYQRMLFEKLEYILKKYGVGIDNWKY